LAIHEEAQARLRMQDQALRQQADRLSGFQSEHERLSNLLARTASPRTIPDEQFNEVLRLRGEVGRLQAAVQELAGPKTNEPLSREEVLASTRQMYLDRVNGLKQLFAADPGEAVPELQYLTDRDWLELVTYDHHQIDPDKTQAVSSARSRAQIHFAMSELSHALREYGKSNNGQFPTDLSQLVPYFKSSVDASVLAGWVILPSSRLPEELRGEENWAITQKAPKNAVLDQRVVVGLKTLQLGRSGSNDWVSVP